MGVYFIADLALQCTAQPPILRRTGITRSLGSRHGDEPCSLEHVGGRILAQGICENDTGKPVTRAPGGFRAVIAGDFQPSQVAGLANSAEDQRGHRQHGGLMRVMGTSFFQFSCRWDQCKIRCR